MNSHPSLLLAALLALAAAGSADHPTTHSRTAPYATSTARQPSAVRDSVGDASALPRESGPALTIIGDLAELYSPVIFDHALHEQMSAITGDCANCHHETSLGEPIRGCADCHLVERAADDLTIPSLKGAFHRQCLGCHKDWSHANSCGSCHEEAGGAMHGPMEFEDSLSGPPTHISPATTYAYHTGRPGVPVVTFHHDDHVRVFGVACADCHQEDTCDRCHGADTSHRVVDRHRDCTNCHASSDCVTCHDVDVKASFDHKVVSGWDLGDGHSGVLCADCHGLTLGAEPGSATSTRCIACHQIVHAAGAEAEPTGVALLGSHALFDCVQCHTGAGNRQRPSCGGCHDQMTFPEYSPGLVAQQ